MFLHLSVILFTGGVCLSACWDTHTPQGRYTPDRQPPRHKPPGQNPPPGRNPTWADIPSPNDHCSGRYASYWNALLFAFAIAYCEWTLKPLHIICILDKIQMFFFMHFNMDTMFFMFIIDLCLNTVVTDIILSPKHKFIAVFSVILK